MKDSTFLVDQDGYLRDSADWNLAIARLLAEHENIILTEEHVLIIQALRDFHQEFNIKVIPTRAFLKWLATVMAPAKYTSTYLYTLFPKGLTQIAKIAGLPKSTRCSKDIF